MSVAKFRKILGNNEKKRRLGLFQVVQCGKFETKDSNIEFSKGMQKLIEKYGNVFRSDLPSGLPPMREVDHEIIVEEDVKPPHRLLYQLSPTVLKAAKEYIVELLKNGKIRPRKSPHGAPLFFVKDEEKPLRGVVDYRAVNRITKKNSSPLPRCDEMFDRLGAAKYFSKMDLKTVLHQIRVKPEDIEKQRSIPNMNSLSIWLCQWAFAMHRQLSSL